MNEGLVHGSSGAFIAATVLIFVCTLSAASSVGLVPYYIDGTEPTRSARTSVAIADLPELGEEIAVVAPVVEEEIIIGRMPDRIRIAKIGLDLPVQNPTTRDIAALDELLKAGPARYVDSALLGEKGNILIFGHSSHLPVVHNAMYKAFNRVPELVKGDSITVEGAGEEYVYRVTSVTKVNAETGIIDISKTGKKLTIVTCDTLTSKSSRYVVEAELVGSLGR